MLFPELAASDVVVTNSRYIFDQALAEYTIGLMLALCKDLPATVRHQTEHRWKQRETESLSGKVVLMVGVGPIARRTAQLAKAIGMSVRGIGRSARAGDPDFGDIAGPDALPALFTDADYVVMVLPSTPETQGMVGPPRSARSSRARVSSTSAVAPRSTRTRSATRCARGASPARRSTS